MNRRQLLQKLVVGPLLSPLALLPVEVAAVAGGAVSVAGKTNQEIMDEIYSIMVRVNGVSYRLPCSK